MHPVRARLDSKRRQVKEQMRASGYKSSEVLEVLGKTLGTLEAGGHDRLASVLAEAATAESDTPARVGLVQTEAESLRSRLLIACGRDVLDRGLVTTDEEVAQAISRIEMAAGEVSAPAAAAALEAVYTELAEYGPSMMGSTVVSALTGAVSFPTGDPATQAELSASARLVEQHNDLDEELALLDERAVSDRPDVDDPPELVAPALSDKLAAATAAVSRSGSNMSPDRLAQAIMSWSR